MKSLLIILVVSVAVAKRTKKFCPKEKQLVDEEGKKVFEIISGKERKVYGDDDNDGEKCKSKLDQYKCGAFFENLREGTELTWLAALPEALKKVEDIDIKEVVGEDISKESFNNIDCDDESESLRVANARCYTLLTKFVRKPLDSCGKNLVNIKGNGTAGGELCKQVGRWLKRDDEFKANGKRDIKIAFHYSVCGGDWTPVKSDGEPIYAKEDLCCKADGTFERCNGEEFTTSDICEEIEDLNSLL